MDYLSATQGLDFQPELWQATPGNSFDKARRRLQMMAIKLWQHAETSIIEQFSELELKEHLRSKAPLLQQKGP